MSKSTKVSDIDQAGNVLCTYTESEKEGLKIVSPPLRCLVAPATAIAGRALPV